MKKPENAEKPQVYKDVWEAILNDKWMNIVVWGPPREGKTTVQLKIAYAVYKDWDQVLDAFVYSIQELMYKMKRGIPCRIMTRNKLHNRVPLLMPDDLGAHGNKAKTQHIPAWDIFKGAIDTYGTKIGVFLSSMGTPDSITLQLQGKYTHEIFVETFSYAKYDKVHWRQNFRGWQPERKKQWRDEFRFDHVPMDVYKQYDEQRMELVDLLNQQIEDALNESETERVINRLEPVDKDFLSLVKSKGVLHRSFFNDPKNDCYREVMKRAKSRSLVISVNHGNGWDLTDFGLNVLVALEKTKPDLDREQKEVPTE
jgi:hypothetical protein